MAKPKKIEPKITIEREYIVPLRKGWLKVPKYKRGNKAVKTLKEFIARHMKVYDKDLRKVKIELELNNEIRFRGMYKPPARIKVRAKKYDNGIVRVELVNLPAHVKFAKLREEKKKTELDKKAKAKEVLEQAQKPKEEVKPEEKTEETEESKEKQEAAKEENLKIAEQQAKEIKHTSKEKQVERQVTTQRKALSR
jgi:large subunit ribosomal protein L31e